MASPAFKQLRLGSLAAAAALALTAHAANVKPVTWEEIANDHKSTADVLTYGLGLTAQRPRKLESRSHHHRQVVADLEKRRFRDAYQERQEEFIALHQEKTYLFPKGGRAGQLMGRMGQLEEWFRENPWR